MYRVWYSTESFADFIIDNTELKHYKTTKYKLLESDAKTTKFHYMPDHIKKILVLDAPDLIIEKIYETYLSPYYLLKFPKNLVQDIMFFNVLLGLFQPLKMAFRLFTYIQKLKSLQETQKLIGIQ